jgi:hypothetical protein
MVVSGIPRAIGGKRRKWIAQPVDNVKAIQMDPWTRTEKKKPWGLPTVTGKIKNCYQG